MLEDCRFRFDDPLFGLEFAAAQDPDIFGTVMMLARTAPNVASAIQVFTERLPKVVSPDGYAETVQSSDIAELIWKPDPKLRSIRQINYHGIEMTLKVLRTFGSMDFVPRYVALSFSLSSAEAESLGSRVGARCVEGRTITASPPTQECLARGWSDRTTPCTPCCQNT